MAPRWPRLRLSRSDWIWTSMCTFAAVALAVWLFLDPLNARRNRLSAPRDPESLALLEELREIARMESASEGSGRERAQRLIPLLFTTGYPTTRSEIVHGPAPRWSDCTVVLVGDDVSGCYWSGLGWTRLEATPEGARGVLLGASGGTNGEEWFAEEATLERGEFLAVTRAFEVIAGVQSTKPEHFSELQYITNESSGSLRVVGRSGVLFQDQHDRLSGDLASYLRCRAAERVASVVIRSRDLRRFQPTDADRVWMHDAYRTMPRREWDGMRDRYHGVLFERLGDPEGVVLVRQAEIRREELRRRPELRPKSKPSRPRPEQGRPAGEDEPSTGE